MLTNEYSFWFFIDRNACLSDGVMAPPKVVDFLFCLYQRYLLYCFANTKENLSSVKMPNYKPEISSKRRAHFKNDPLKREQKSMNPRVYKVVANENFALLRQFTNDEIRLFDARPYLEKGIFREL